MATEPKLQVDTRVVVETPEGVDFRFVIAGPGKRGLSYVIDYLIKAVVVAIFIFVSAFFSLFGELGAGLQGFGLLVMLFMLDWFYGSLFEALWNGQTPGKRLMSLRVVRTNGTPINFLSAVGRNFLLVADQQPAIVFPTFTVAVLAALTNRRMQRLGDLAFDTMVIDETREWITRAVGITNGVETISRADCPRRYHVPERTLSVIERLFESDRIIPDARREEIAKPLSIALRKRLGYTDPPEPMYRNAYEYHQKNQWKHTIFLRRILKTFVDDKNTDEQAQQDRMKNGVSPGIRGNQTAPRRPGLRPQSENSDVSLDQWISGSDDTTASDISVEVVSDDTDWIVGDSQKSFPDPWGRPS